VKSVLEKVSSKMSFAFVKIVLKYFEDTRYYLDLPSWPNG